MNFYQYRVEKSMFSTLYCFEKLFYILENCLASSFKSYFFSSVFEKLHSEIKSNFFPS